MANPLFVATKVKRGTLTTFIKKELDLADALYNRSPASNLVQEQLLVEVESSVSKLEDYSSQYEELCTKIVEFMAEAKKTEDEITAEVEKTTDLSLQLKESISNLNAMKNKLQRRLQSGDSKALLEIEKQRLAVERTRLETEQDEIQRRKAKETADKYCMKVPEAKLEIFDGDVLKWPQFSDSWTATVDSNDALADVQKLKLLKDHVMGPASDTISHFWMRDANYKEALAALKKRYDDPQAVIAAHYDALIKLPAVNNKNDVARLRTVFNSVDCHLRSLAGVGQKIDPDFLLPVLQKIDPDFLLPVLQSKIPSDILFDLHMRKGRDENFTVESLRKYLDDYLYAKELASRDSAKSTPKREHEKHLGPEEPAGSKLKPPTGQTLTLTDQQKRFPRGSVGDQPSAGSAGKGCAFCGKTNHLSYDCRTYPDAEKRKAVASEKGMCFRCLRDNHFSKECRSQRGCYYCGVKWHNSALCQEQFPGKQDQQAYKKSTTKKPTDKGSTGKKEEEKSTKDTTGSSKKNPEIKEVTSAVLSPNARKFKNTMYPTALAEVRVPGSKTSYRMRIGFDSFGSRSYMLLNQAQRLKVPLDEKESIAIFHFDPNGDGEATDFDSSPVEIEVLCNDGSSVQLTAYVVKRIIGGKILRKPSDFGASTNFVKTLDLADPLPETPEEVDIELLIGLNALGQFWCSEILNLSRDLSLQRSKVGWLTMGEIPGESADVGVSCLIMSRWKNDMLDTSVSTVVNQSQEALQLFDSPDKQLKVPPNLEDMWDLERIGIKDSTVLSDDDIAVSQFNETVEFSDGRYTVGFPKKCSLSELSDNFALCLGRLRSLLNRLKPDPVLLGNYNKIVVDQKAQTMIEIVTEESETGPVKHYIPHHPVITPEKLTTKIRMVFDGGAKSRKGMKSLNECLLRGKVMLADMIGLSLRFRLKLIAILADIQKAFLQLNLRVADRDLTRFLWLKDPNGPVEKDNLQIYRFCRVPFGINSSPFLLSYTVDYHLKSVGTDMAEEIRKNIYVDNVICGANSIEEAEKIYTEGKQIMLDASLYLREWTSKSKEFLSRVEDRDRTKESTVKVLGLSWNTETDEMSISEPRWISVSTKRDVLKAYASIFDPLGFFCPVTVAAKLFMQKLWEIKLDWDEQLNKDLLREWTEIEEHMKQISGFKFARLIGKRNLENAEFDLLCFCDASVNVFDANVYLRVSTVTSCTVDLIYAKARVAPANKQLTVPRMELLSAFVGSKILNFCEQQLRLDIQSKTLFSDSQCVLSWLKSAKQLSVFVENRVNEIKKIEGTSFRYIPTDQNPADLATRRCTWEEFSNSQLWWHGPDWLTKPKSEWPNFSVPEITAEMLRSIESEQKPSPAIFEAGLCVGEAPSGKNFLNLDPAKFSSLGRLFGVTAWILRFVAKLKHQQVAIGPITATEIRKARFLWEKETQRKHFPEVLNALRSSKGNNLVKQLGLQIDSTGILRCHGRMENADLSEDAIFPILLPKKDPFTDLTVSNLHKILCHCGVSQTVSQLRLRYWVPHARTVVKGVILRCQVCRRAEGGAFKAPPMAQWPRARVSCQSPFSYVGCDYLGPLYVKEKDGSSSKVWVCLFTCLTVRAVHLELIRDFSAEHFLYGLRRFMSVRGTPVQMSSDNRGQFTATKTALDKLWIQISRDNDVVSYIANKGFSWHFIPELSPWMGGMWERLVGLVKRSLRKSIGRLTTLSFEQLRTLLSEVEAVLNSRPLVFVGSDLDERFTLCPADFLSLNPKQGFPGLQFDPTDPDYKEGPDSTADILLETWRKGQVHLDNFWKLWHQDYLLSLRERSQRELKGPRVKSVLSPQVGDVVLIKEDKLPRGAWKIARIESLTLSADKLVRSAKVRLPSGSVLTRSVTYLYPLECPDRQITQYDVGDGMDDVITGQADEHSKDDVIPTRPTRKAAEIGRRKVAGWARQLMSDDD